MASEGVVLYTGGGGAGGRTIMHLLCNGPREVLLLVIGRLSLADQASLSEVNRELRAVVRPVMNGWVWQDSPLPIRDMLTSAGTLQWHHVLTAESCVPVTYGYVACHWCSNVHAPTVAIDPECKGFACQRLPRSWYEGRATREVSPFYRPVSWHPHVLYALARYSQQGRETATLRQQTMLDRFQSHEDDLTLGAGEWKAVWRAGHGLFLRKRSSDRVLYNDDLSPPPESCCLCGAYTKVWNYSAIGDVVDEAAVAQTPTESTVMLDETHRRSATLVAGPVDGCNHCGLDWQAAHTISPDGKMWAHWTTWFHLGNPSSVDDVIESLKDRHRRRNPGGIASLGVGNVARLSGLTDDYPDQ